MLFRSPIGEDSVNAVTITVCIGRPIPAVDLLMHARGNRRLIMDCVGIAIAEMLPPSYRGEYADTEQHDQARVLYRQLFH